jgi:hypothetical protein
MSRDYLFQVVDPNAGHTCTIVSFQKSDRQFIEKRKATLEKELCSVLAPGESENVFQNNEDGIWFGGHVRTRNGKPIALSMPHKADMEYIQQAESRLKSLQAKRDFTAATNQQGRPPMQITYSGILQARTCTMQSVSVQDTEGTTTTTTTQTSQTVTAMMEARFQGIEIQMQTQKEHQANMDNRLHILKTARPQSTTTLQ